MKNGIKQQPTDYCGGGGGLALGLAVGAVAGSHKANKIIAPHKNFLNELGSMTRDEFVNTRIEANTENVINGVRDSKINKAIAKVAEKAGQDFDKAKNALKTAKGTRNKWIAGLAAAGAVAGVIAGAIIKKKSK